MARNAAVLVLIAALGVVAAHVVPVPSPAIFKGGSYGQVGLKVGHGCDGSPTKEFFVEIPESFTAVKPRPVAGWTIDMEYSDYSMPTTLHGTNVSSYVSKITWTGNLPDEYFEVFEISFKLREMEEVAELLAESEMPVNGTRMVYLRSTQLCDEGSHEWVELDPESESPAPYIIVDESGKDAHSH